MKKRYETGKFFTNELNKFKESVWRKEDEKFDNEPWTFLFGGLVFLACSSFNHYIASGLFSASIPLWVSPLLTPVFPVIISAFAVVQGIVINSKFNLLAGLSDMVTVVSYGGIDRSAALLKLLVYGVLNGVLSCAAKLDWLISPIEKVFYKIKSFCAETATMKFVNKVSDGVYRKLAKKFDINLSRNGLTFGLYNFIVSPIEIAMAPFQILFAVLLFHTNVNKKNLTSEEFAEVKEMREDVLKNEVKSLKSAVKTLYEFPVVVVEQTCRTVFTITALPFSLMEQIGCSIVELLNKKDRVESEPLLQ